MMIKKRNLLRGGFWVHIIVTLLLLAISPLFVSAQSQPTIQILSIDSQNFPTITLDYKAIGLNEPLPTSPTAVEILEDNQSITPDSIEEHYQGVHFAVAINPDASLTVRGPDSKPYNIAMLEALKTVGPEPENLRNNRYSYFNNPEVTLVETDDYSAWASLIDNMETIPAESSSSLNSLELAVSALEHSSLSLDTILVYITPYLDYRVLPEFYALLDRAAELGVQIHVWIVMSPRVVGSSYEIEMQSEVQSSGGTLTALTNSQLVPEPRGYMEGKGRVYSAQYQSSLRAAADYEVSVRVERDQQPSVQSAPAMLSINVQPTRLSFVNLPETLEIRFNNDGSFQPAQLPLEVLIEFPDGYPRQILNATLFINGSRVVSNTQPPYGNFLLNLADYVEEEELRLEVRLQDDFGLQGRTDVHTISLDVFKPEETTSTAWFLSPWIWIGLLAAAGVIAVVIFRKPLTKKQKAEEEEETELSDNRTVEKPEAPSPVPIKSFGSLVRLDPDQTPSAEKPHLLTNEITLIGRDPGVANLVLDLTSIEPLHAEIHFFPDGRIRLTDFNSTSGSYVNFKPVGTHGTTLQHADLIHFGTLLFRFNSASRTQTSPPKE